MLFRSGQPGEAIAFTPDGTRDDRGLATADGAHRWFSLRGTAPWDAAVSGPLPPETSYILTTRQEQAPNPESRIVLGTEKDELGMPLANLRWKFTKLDKRSIRIFDRST